MVPASRRLGWFQGVCAVAMFAAASIAQAQAQGDSARQGRADPLDAQARVPAVTHQSPLANYRRLGDDTRVSWREANETVNRIGGWRTYTREAQQPDPAASAPVGRGTPAPASNSGPSHGGHKMH